MGTGTNNAERNEKALRPGGGWQGENASVKDGAKGEKRYDRAEEEKLSADPVLGAAGRVSESGVV